MFMNQALTALTIDLTVVLGCTFFLFKLGRPSAMHPGIIYLFFHLFVVTKRLTELACGAPLSAMFPHQPIGLNELTRASLLFDLVLVMMTLAWIITSAVDWKRHGPLPEAGREKPPNLSKIYVVGFAWLLVPAGIYGILKPGGGGGDWDKSFALTTLQSLLIISLMLFFYWYGPKPWLVAAIVVADVISQTLSDERWLLLLPTIFYCFVYICRQGSRWPNRKTLIVMGVAALLWLPGKQISHILSRGGNLAQASQAFTSTWISSATEANHPDNQFLDMAAMTVSLVDEKRHLYYGATVFDALYNFIPRPLWPDKPRGAEWEYDISTKDRPMMTYGMTASMMGGAYVDFGYAGVVLIPFLFALFLGWAYFRAFRCAYFSVGRFCYLVMACTLLQPYRDGIHTFLIFNFIYLWPLCFVALLHLFFPTRPARAQSRYPQFARMTVAERSAQLSPPPPVPETRRATETRQA